ncbi:MAG: hypothetical protein K2Y21_10460 [Phycisphaerales bacterium]|nr:hypothetical protein [Phycisphaerales bacterium]
MSALHDRLKIAVGDRSTKHLGELTSTHPESVRRYMLGAAPSPDFLAAVCRGLGINADWLLTGNGPMKREDLKRFALLQSRGGELLQALAAEVERLTQRVERLEHFVQTMETRLRVASGEGVGSGGVSKGAVREPGPDTADPIGFIADALTKRPPETPG